MAAVDDGAKEDGDEDPSANQRVGEGKKRKIGGPSPCATKDFGPWHFPKPRFESVRMVRSCGINLANGGLRN